MKAWPLRKLVDVAPATPLKTTTPKDNEEVWHLGLEHIQSDTGRLLEKTSRPFGEVGSSTHWFDTSHVLFSKLRPNLNKVLIPDDIGVATSELVRMTPDNSILDRKFLAYYLRSQTFLDWVTTRTTGAKMPRASMKLFWQYKIPLPPLPEQKKIAAILDAADALRQKDQQLIEHYTRLSQSLFLEMFGDPVGNPMGWDTCSLAEHGSFKNGLNYTKGESGKKVKYLGVGDFKSHSKIDNLKPLAYINLNELPSDEYFLKNKDLVFVRSNGNGKLVGRCVIMYLNDTEVTFSGFCIRYRIKTSDLSATYLSHLFREDSFRKKLLISGRGANIQNINQKLLSTLPIRLPPIKIQNQFAQHIEAIEQQKQQAQASLEKSEALFNSLLQRAFKGELTQSKTA